MTTFIIIIFIFVFIISAIIAGKNKTKYKPYKKCEYKEYKNYGINTINSNKGNLYNSLYTNNKKIDTTNTAKHFNISTKEISKIFSNLKWIEQNGKWEIATNLGIRNGAEQKYNALTKQKYIMWDEEIKNNSELVNALKVFKENINIKKEMTNIEKKEKGAKYEEYIANYFRENGYYVWEHGKEKGVKDSGLDLFVKKKEYIYFVQCKDWEKWKIDHNTVQAIQTKIRNFLKKEEGLRKLSNGYGYTKKILYVTSKECLTAGAYKYIEENNDILEYQVIPIGA